LIKNPDYKNTILYKRKINQDILLRLNNVKRTAVDLIQSIEECINEG